MDLIKNQSQRICKGNLIKMILIYNDSFHPFLDAIHFKIRQEITYKYLHIIYLNKKEKRDRWFVFHSRRKENRTIRNTDMFYFKSSKGKRKHQSNNNPLIHRMMNFVSEKPWYLKEVLSIFKH